MENPKALVIQFRDGTQQTVLVLEHISEPTVQVMDSSGTRFIVRASSCRPATEAEFRLFWSNRSIHGHNHNP